MSAGTVVGAVLALVVLGVVVGAIIAEVLGRQRELAAPRPRAGARSGGVRLVVRMLAVGLVALALSVGGAAVLNRAALAQEDSVFLSGFAASMALVALATVVGTLWAGPNLAVGSAVGLTAGPLPLSAIFWVLLQEDRDPQAPIAGILVTLVALAVAAAAWAVTIGIARRSRAASLRARS